MADERLNLLKNKISLDLKLFAKDLKRQKKKMQSLHNRLKN